MAAGAAVFLVFMIILGVIGLMVAFAAVPALYNRFNSKTRNLVKELTEARAVLKEIERTCYRDRDVYPEYVNITNIIDDSKLKELTP